MSFLMIVCFKKIEKRDTEKSQHVRNILAVRSLPPLHLPSLKLLLANARLLFLAPRATHGVGRRATFRRGGSWKVEILKSQVAY